MFLILKVVLIILLHETYAYITRDSEILLLPAWNPIGAEEISLTLKVFGKQIQLNLRRNDQIVSAFKMWKHNVKIITEKLSQLNAPDSCYYFHEDHISTAAINFCQEHGLEGVVSLENTTLDISPLRNYLATSSLIDNSCVEIETNVSFGKLHLIKHFPNSNLFHVNKHKPRQRRSLNDPIKQHLNLELAIFLDETAYNRLFFLHEHNETKLRTMLLAYVNSLEAVLQHPSLGVSINILLRYMEIMEVQPVDLPVEGGLAGSLWYSFCTYANMTLNRIGNSSNVHWDIALYLTGLNLYGNMDYNLHGFSAFNSTLIRGWTMRNKICDRYSCAIAEFSTVDGEYSIPTTGFGSVYTAAQQIGHLFGMTLDGMQGSNCTRDGYIMSFNWKNDFDRIVWSSCSREIAKELYKTKQCLLDGQSEDTSFLFRIDLSGRVTQRTYYNDNRDSIKREWNAKKQCELFLRDTNADVVTLDDFACQFLQCEGPGKRSSFMRFNYLDHEYEYNFNNYFAGPALDGTHCAYRKECRHGTCSRVKTSSYRDDGNWSEWEEEPCKKNCLEKSKGVIIRRRICRDMNDKLAICEGSPYDVKLCDDSSLCSEKPRLPINIYMNKICEQETLTFFSLLKEGMQMTHDFERPWLACSIFCRKKKEVENEDVIAFHALIEELSSTIRSYPYLPDGTWCHTDNETGQHFYCRKHQCLLESSKMIDCRKSIY